MLVVALLAAAASQQAAATRPTPVVQATATIRIISGERLKLGQQPQSAQLRQAQFRDSDGQVRPARLIEFQ